MEKYLGLTSGRIYSMMQDEIQNAIGWVRKAKWRDGTKPQDRALDAIQKCAVRLEEIYESYLKDHIKVIRILNGKGIKCEKTLECVNIINTLKNKGGLEVLKKYYPQLGKDLPPAIKRDKSKFDGTPMYIDDSLGLYGRDWVWAQAGGYTGKLSQHNNIGYKSIKIISTADVRAIGHQGLQSMSNQLRFEMHLTSAKKYPPSPTKMVTDRDLVREDLNMGQPQDEEMDRGYGEPLVYGEPPSFRDEALPMVDSGIINTSGRNESLSGRIVATSKKSYPTYGQHDMPKKSSATAKGSTIGTADSDFFRAAKSASMMWTSPFGNIEKKEESEPMLKKKSVPPPMPSSDLDEVIGLDPDGI